MTMHGELNHDSECIKALPSCTCIYIIIRQLLLTPVDVETDITQKSVRMNYVQHLLTLMIFQNQKGMGTSPDPFRGVSYNL